MQGTLASLLAKLHRNRAILAWLTPILIACGVFLVILVNPFALHDRVFLPVLVIFGLVAPVGGFWAIYQSIRYEKNPWKCILVVVFIPFGFVWYYFEKYRKRTAD
jgi:hypothetical protein